MAKKTTSILSEIGKSGDAPAPRRRARPGYLETRSDTLGELTSGVIEDKIHKRVDPARCRMWSRHNRRYDLLTEASCQGLIDGFKRQGKQEFPAIVRPVTDDPKYDYEVICGARRHWTVTFLRENNYPDFLYLIEVRELTDEAAFRLSDLENRDREDLSDIERATDYREALKLYYRTQKEMAARLEVSEAWLSRYLDLATLPKRVLAAFGDVTVIKTKHGKDLKPFLKSAKDKRKLLAAADDVSKRQQQRLDEGRALIAASQVVSALVQSLTAKPKAARGTLAEFESAGGKPMLSVTRQGRSGLVLRVVPKSGATNEEILAACATALEQYGEKIVK